MIRRSNGGWRTRVAGVAAAGSLVAALGSPVAAQAGAPPTLDLKVLLIGLPGSPQMQAWQSELRRDGVPFDAASAIPSGLTVSGDPTHGRYNAVVFTDDTQNWSGTGFVGSTHLDPNWPALRAYETDFAVRQVDGYETSVQVLALNEAHTDGNLNGGAAHLTAGAQQAVFLPYSTGAVGFDSFADPSNAAYGYAFGPSPTAPTAAVAFLTAPAGVGSLIQRYGDGAGHDELLVSVSYNDAMQHWRILGRGLLDWATRGVHLGYDRNYLSMQVDDIFQGDLTWSTLLHCTPGDSPPDPYCPAGVGPSSGTEVMMSPVDVDNAADWEASHGLTLTLAFNGAYTNVDAAHQRLADALLSSKHSFRWVNHTWEHTYLGRTCAAYSTATPTVCTALNPYPSTSVIQTQIAENQRFASDHHLPGYRAQELVTGEHSGLDNPNTPAALASTGISSLASDASRSYHPCDYSISDPDAALAEGRTCLAPGLLAAPVRLSARHPNNIFYNVATWTQEVDEYNQLYHASDAAWPHGRCVASAVTTCLADGTVLSKADILAAETRILLGYVLGNDPRVEFAHQTNLTGDRVLLDLLDAVLARYHEAFGPSAPLVPRSLSQAGNAVHRAESWAATAAGGAVTGSVQGTVVTIHNAGNAAASVPLTLPTGSTDSAGPFGSAYAGTSSAWTPVPTGETSFTVPAG